jgi:hypothetical protein
MEAVYVVGAALFNFILICVWFHQRPKCSRREGSDLESSIADPTPYLIGFIGSLWTSYGLFLMIKHIRPNSVAELVTLVLGLWFFIIIGTSAKFYTFAGESFINCLKDKAIDLVGILIMSFIIW